MKLFLRQGQIGRTLRAAQRDKQLVTDVRQAHLPCRGEQIILLEATLHWQRAINHFATTSF